MAFNGQWTLFLYQDMLGFARLTEGNPFHTAAGLTPVDQWSHLAVTRNGTTYRLWVNGAEANATTRGDLPASDAVLTIGTDAYGDWLPHGCRPPRCAQSCLGRPRCRNRADPM